MKNICISCYYLEKAKEFPRNNGFSTNNNNKFPFNLTYLALKLYRKIILDFFMKNVMEVNNLAKTEIYPRYINTAICVIKNNFSTGSSLIC